MDSLKLKEIIYPIAVYAGGMIGVGFLALPYVALQSGIWLTILYFILVTAVVLAINLIFAEVSLKTPDFKRFPGFAEYYLGSWGRMFAMICAVGGAFGVLLAYLIIGAKFLSVLLEPVFSGGLLLYMFLYLFVGAIFIFQDIKVVKKVELVVVSFLLLSMLLIFVEGFTKIRFENISIQPSISVFRLFLPYGPILFSLWGLGLIPDVEEMLEGRKDLLKKVITISTIGVSLVYIIFTLLILSISGAKTNESALLGLQSLLGSGAVTLSLIVGVMASLTGFITQGIILKKVFVFDLKMDQGQALMITILTPFILLFLGFSSFVFLLSFIGAFFLGITGIMILLMYKKIGGDKMLIYPLAVVFILGILYQAYMSFIT